MNEKDFNPNSLYSKLQSATNATGNAHFSKHHEQEVKVQIRPDTKISPAMFKPDPLIPGGYLAHPITIRAVRPEVFVGGEECFEDLEYWIKCDSCKSKVDLQFWKFCPYCEASFPKELPKPLKSHEL